ncbi:hypothetical protein ACFQX6_10240 [Streptosporangium lutulentum]
MPKLVGLDCRTRRSARRCRARPCPCSAVAEVTAEPYGLAHLDHARHFADRLRQTSAAPVVYAELRGGNHAFDLYHSVRFEAVVDAVEAFTARVRSQKRTPQP